jgi:hypothetical protein
MHHEGEKILPVLWKIGAFPDRLSRRKQERPDQIHKRYKLSAIQLKFKLQSIRGVYSQNIVNI